VSRDGAPVSQPEGHGPRACSLHHRPPGAIIAKRLFLQHGPQSCSDVRIGRSSFRLQSFDLSSLFSAPGGRSRPTPRPPEPGLRDEAERTAALRLHEGSSPIDADPLGILVKATTVPRRRL